MIKHLSAALRYATAVAIVCLTTVSVQADAPELKPSIAKWKPHMAKFAAADKKNPVEPGQIVFVGSSSIVLWKLDKWFPELDAVNRGFGGSRLEDSVYYADQIILPYKPRTVVLYAGDNDLKAGYTPAEVHEDFVEFVEKVRGELPETKIVYVAVKPSIARWGMIKEVRETNRLIKAECEKRENCVFVDIDTPMQGEDGKPRKELFVKDGLHLSDEGYAVWVKAVKPHLKDE